MTSSTSSSGNSSSSSSSVADLAIYAALALGVPLAAFFYDWKGFVELFAWFERARLEPCHPDTCKLPFPLPPISVADLFGSAMVCIGYRKVATFPKHWLETLLVCTIMQFGGTTITGWLLGQSPSWMTSHTAMPALVLMWWLTFFCPFDAWFKVVELPGPTGAALRGFLQLGAWFSTGHAVTSWGMDKALDADHVKATNSMLTALVTGTMSACGGGLIAADMLGEEWTFGKPPALRRPTVPLQKGMVCSLFYYLLRDPHHVLRTTAAAGWLFRLNFAIAKEPRLVAIQARAWTGLLMYELSLHAYSFPGANLIEKAGGLLGKLFLITPIVDPPKAVSGGGNGSSSKKKKAESKKKK
jgi:uncharacterized membrane protein YeiH